MSPSCPRCGSSLDTGAGCSRCGFPTTHWATGGYVASVVNNDNAAILARLDRIIALLTGLVEEKHDA